MHLPDGIISINQAFIYWLIAIIFVIISTYKFSKSEGKEKRLVSTAIFAVFTILIGSLSIPSPLGLPIHFFIIPLVAIILGPLNGSIVSFISLLFQGLFLGMGGLTSLGANFIVMGLVLSFATYGSYNILKELNHNIAIFASTIVGIIFATFAQVLILLISGAMNFDSLLASLVPFYLFISIIEGFANMVIINLIEKVRPEIIEENKV